MAVPFCSCWNPPGPVATGNHASGRSRAALLTWGRLLLLEVYPGGANMENRELLMPMQSMIVVHRKSSHTWLDLLASWPRRRSLAVQTSTAQAVRRLSHLPGVRGRNCFPQYGVQ